MHNIEPVLNHIDGQLDAPIERLFDLLRIKSISTDPAFMGDCAKAADWLVRDLKTIGFKARVVKTPGHPMVLAHHHKAKGAPTVLFYGHYDVQPVDPLSLWDNPPFEPKIVTSEKKGKKSGTKQMIGRGTRLCPDLFGPGKHKDHFLVFDFCQKQHRKAPR